MALIDRFEESAGTRDKLHDPVVCGWRVVDIDGRLLLQLDTYGSPERDQPGRVSQTIQLDKTRAVALLAILREAFPGIA